MSIIIYLHPLNWENNRIPSDGQRFHTIKFPYVW